jgi:DNA adenine methylase
MQKNKPFLRWAGGKNWLTKYLPLLIGDLDYNDYHEPFLGGGSVFFNLLPNNPHLSDSNEELINCYIGLRDNSDQVIEQLSKWIVSEEDYYKIRKLSPTSAPIKSARFIYLNRTSYNGIYRVNKDGHYNVPYGHNDLYKFDFDRLINASNALQNVDIQCLDYLLALDKVKTNDLVFIDPPYTVSKDKNGFIQYNQKLFSIEDQFKLRQAIDRLNSIGAYFILTNAAHEKIAEIFDGIGVRYELNRNSLLGGKNAKRQQIQEYVFTNIQSGGCHGVE